jgi:2'-5' RNA ligase
MTNFPDAPQSGSVALVSYIPDPLGSFLHSLRKLLPGDEDPQAHITILPPRPLRLPLQSPSPAVKKVLEGFSRFEVELSSVRRFPETNYLYLDVADGNTKLHALHDALNAGELSHVERFPYRPHLTIGGPVEAESLDSVLDQASRAWQTSECSPRLVIDEIVCLWLRPGGDSSQWSRLWSHWLSGQAGKGAAAGNTTRTS